jgi:hypothetical protein
MKLSRKHARPVSARENAVANVRVRRRRVRLRARAGEEQAPTDECVCSFGATRVGAMIERVRLHVTTDRFLAWRRGDKMWEAACDYAALSLARLESRLRPTVLAEWICATAGAGRSATGGAARSRGAAGGRR